MLHDQKITTIADPNFRIKISEGAFQEAKGIILGTISNTSDNVKRFCQIVVKDIASASPSWLDGLAYFSLSTSTAIDLTSTQSQVSAQVAVAFPYYAKAIYGDIT